MFQQEDRLRALSQKAIDGTVTDEEFAELTKLSRAKKQIRDKKAALIAELQQNIAGQQITMQELFSAQEIYAAASTIGLPGRPAQPGTGVPLPRKTQGKQSPSDGTNRNNGISGTAGVGESTGTWVRQKRGLVLIEIKKPGTQGLPCRYCQGQTMSFYVPPALKALDDGHLDSNLDRHTTDAGRAYFATAEGQAERAQLLEYIRTRKLKPTSVP
jgi:hypothetical protein